jgi:hypothetical protein
VFGPGQALGEFYPFLLHIVRRRGPERAMRAPDPIVLGEHGMRLELRAQIPGVKCAREPPLVVPGRSCSSPASRAEFGVG